MFEIRALNTMDQSVCAHARMCINILTNENLSHNLSVLTKGEVPQLLVLDKPPARNILFIENIVIPPFKIDRSCQYCFILGKRGFPHTHRQYCSHKATLI